MFHIFKKTKQFTSYLELHKEIEKKMSMMVAGDAMRTLKIRSMKDITNGNVHYDSLTNEQLNSITRQMQETDLIIVKATAEMIRKYNNGNIVVFDDHTIYSIIQNAQGLIHPKELNAFENRESMIKFIEKNAELVLRMESNMLIFLTNFARENNQAVVVHG